MTTPARRCFEALAALVMLGLSSTATGHDARPLSVVIVEQTDDLYRTVVRVPPTVETRNAPRIVWPAPCTPADETTGSRPGLVQTLYVRCAGGLESRTISIEYPFFNPSITSLIRLETLEWGSVTSVLPPDALEWTAPAEPSFAGIAGDYLRLGFTHIWEGIDHLLFVAGLLLLAGRPGRIVRAITGFTIAHSITLSLAALGMVRVPVAPVEAMIAMSILFLAADIARGDRTTFSYRYPIVLSFVFGLLHGFGFASALGETGLPPGGIVTGLMFFNIGVELGQLAFVAAIALVVFVVRRIGIAGITRMRTASIGLTAAYCLGIPAAYWSLERTVSALGF